MADRACRLPGLRLTLRHQMIGVAYFALVFTTMGAARDGAGQLDLFHGMLWSVLLTPWMLGFLVLLLDRPGPLRNWTVSTLFMLFSPALAVAHDWITAATLLDTGSIPHPVSTLAINVVFLGAFAVYWYYMAPARCPGCGRASLIPLMMLGGQTRRTVKTRWCAGCGGQYWGAGRGPWNKERRRTWLDKGEVPAADPDECPGGHGTDPVLVAQGEDAGDAG